MRRFPPDIEAAHDRAVKRGEQGYLDPRTGLFVMTALGLAHRGHCCDNGCRHCPYREPRIDPDADGS